MGRCAMPGAGKGRNRGRLAVDEQDSGNTVDYKTDKSVTQCYTSDLQPGETRCELAT